MEKDMTVGSPMGMIVSFTVPIFLGNVFQQFYSMADTIIVGKFVGTNALAAVGSVGTIMFLLIGFLMGMTAGFTVLTSQRYGARDMKGMRKTVGSAYTLSIIVSAVMTVFSMLFMKPLLVLMNTPADIFDDAYRYIMVICGGIFAQTAYNLFSSVLRAVGNSKTPLYFLILAAGLNVLLDMLLIIVFKMGAPGAAYATVIAQGVSAALCIFYIIKKVPILKLERDDWRMDWHLMKIQMGIGFPMAFQYSITAIGTMMVQSSLNILGSLAVASFTAASKIEQIFTQAYVALGVTMTNYCAQNRGAGKYSRIRSGFRSAMVIGMGYSLLAAVFFVFAGRYLVYLFVSDNVAEIMGYADIYLKCTAAFLIPLTIVNAFRNGIQGMGYGILPMMAGVAELIGRGATALAASRYKSFFGVCMASPVAWILAGSLLLYMYFMIMKRHPVDVE